MLSVIKQPMTDPRIIMPIVAIIGSYHLYGWYKNFINNISTKSPHIKYISDVDSPKLEINVKIWMLQDLTNKIIQWKLDNPTNVDNYFKFIKMVFPENILMVNDTVQWVDKRIMGKTWVDTFNNTKSTDTIIKLDNPPGI